MFCIEVSSTASKSWLAMMARRLATRWSYSAFAKGSGALSALWQVKVWGRLGVSNIVKSPSICRDHMQNARHHIRAFRTIRFLWKA